MPNSRKTGTRTSLRSALLALGLVVTAIGSANALAGYEVVFKSEPGLAGLEPGLQATNRAQNLVTAFLEQGIAVLPAGQAEPDWQLRLSLSGYGRGEQMDPVGDARLVASANRVDYERSAIVEWYINDERGIEQGFTLYEPPVVSSSAPVALELTIDSTLVPVFAADGQSIEFTRSGGGIGRLLYSKLVVFDAEGRELEARMAPGIDGSGLRLLFDDTGAAYPVTVDPIIATPAWRLDSGSSDPAGPRLQLGHSLDIVGDVNGDGIDDALIAIPEIGFESCNDFGSCSGQVLGFYGPIEGGPGGIVSASTPIDADWSSTGTDGGLHGRSRDFGISLAGAGDVNGDGCDDVLVASWGRDGPDGPPPYESLQLGEGVAYLYLGCGGADGDELSNVESWRFTHNQGGGAIGSYVGIAEGVAGVGDVNGDGYDDIIVTSQFYRSDTDSPPGAAWLFYGSPDGPAGDAQNCLTQVAGVRCASTVDADWTFLGDNPVIVPGPQLELAISAGDLNGDGYADVVFGAYDYYWSDTQESKGVAAVFYGSADGLGGGTPGEGATFRTADWVAVGDGNITFGADVAYAGDINGDGAADLLVGSNQGTSSAFVFHGSASGFIGGPPLGGSPSANSSQADWTHSKIGTTGFGENIAAAGDLGGDGFDDVIVSASKYGDDGAVFIFHGSADGLPDEATTILTGTVGPCVQVWSDQFGFSVAGGGDLNADGHPDILIGESAYCDSLGRAYVFHGAPDASYDGDGDSFPFAEDCDDSGAGFWSAPGEVLSLVADVDGQTFSWDALGSESWGGDSSPDYEMLRSSSSDDFTSAECMADPDAADTSAIDSSEPAAGEVFFYLVRGRNGCSEPGTLGGSSSGDERAGSGCS